MTSLRGLICALNSNTNGCKQAAHKGYGSCYKEESFLMLTYLRTHLNYLKYPKRARSLCVLSNRDPYPYSGLMVHGKKAIENTNWEDDGDNLSLSFSW